MKIFGREHGPLKINMGMLVKIESDLRGKSQKRLIGQAYLQVFSSFNFSPSGSVSASPCLISASLAMAVAVAQSKHITILHDVGSLLRASRNPRQQKLYRLHHRPQLAHKPWSYAPYLKAFGFQGFFGTGTLVSKKFRSSIRMHLEVFGIIARPIQLM